MKRRVTIKDVAREAGVSIALVSMVMHANFDSEGNPDCNIRKKTAQRVLDAIRKLNYIPSAAAAQISNGRSGNIAVITSDIGNSFFSEICREIENQAYQAGYNAIFSSSHENPERLSKAIYSAIKIGVDGMIIVPPTTDCSVMAQVQKLGIPVVFLERDIPDFKNAGRVMHDNEKACHLAMMELYDSGYRKIDMMSYEMDITTVLSKDAYYLKLMKELGLGEYAHIHKVSPNIDVDSVAEIIKAAIAKGTDAMFLPTRRLATKALMASRKAGIRIPDDLAIVGFDRCELFYAHDPSVSYINQPVEQLGEEAFKMMMEIIADPSSARTVVLDPTLVRGGSSAPKPAGSHQ